MKTSKSAVHHCDALHLAQDRYPQNFEQDLSTMRSAGVDMLFVPSVADLYPRGLIDCFVVSPPASFATLAEATARPLHFTGVSTICLKLFNLVRPAVAFFGQKDAMQCVVIRRLVEDLNLRLKVEVAPTVRAQDGLALSSRNAYLAPNERQAAPIVYRALCACRDVWLKSSSSLPAATLVDVVRKVLATEPLVQSVDYVSVADYNNMSELTEVDPPAGYLDSPKVIVSLAVQLGSVRLIDNLPLQAGTGDL